MLGFGGQHYPGALTGAILQGWLRDLRPGRRVGQLQLADMDPQLVNALAACDLLVASLDDLAAEGTDARAQLDALRRTFGHSPTLVVTDSIRGAWLSLPDGRLGHVPVVRPIKNVSPVGAGDAFAAGLLAGMSRGVAALDAAADATNLVGELLAERTGRQLHVIGDVHGMLEPLRTALRKIGLLDAGRSLVRRTRRALDGRRPGGSGPGGDRRGRDADATADRGRDRSAGAWGR